MTNEEAIKWVDDRMCFGRGTFTKNHPPNIDECWEAGCMAIKALKRTRWIPVSKRLPDKDGWYLITVQGYEKIVDMEWYYSEWGAWNGVSSEQQVIAWQPLPEPYKGGYTE